MWIKIGHVCVCEATLFSVVVSPDGGGDSHNCSRTYSTSQKFGFFFDFIIFYMVDKTFFV